MMLVGKIKVVEVVGVDAVVEVAAAAPVGVHADAAEASDSKTR